MANVAIIGAGKIGGAVAKLLQATGDYRLRVTDRDAQALERLARNGIAVQQLEVDDAEALRALLADVDIVISAGPFSVNPTIARAALGAGASYFDLTEDVATTRAIRELAVKAGPGQVFVPQCGLAPGFIGILANDLCAGFDTLDEVKMRVGALPQFPSNHLLYNLTWSTDGLINEYCNPCEAIVDGRLVEVLALEGQEELSLDGITYEAFNTSGGLGTLCETLAGRVRELNYKTVRYPGHRYLMDFLIDGLRLRDRRELLKDILERAVPITMQDVALTFASVSGTSGGQFVQRSDARKIYNRMVLGEHWSSIQITTAAGVCALVDLHREGKLGAGGFVRQESVALQTFMANRFGRYFERDTPVEATRRASDLA